MKEMKEEQIRVCPNCNEEELRPVVLGNDRDGWEFTGDWECDACDYEQSFDEGMDDYQQYQETELNALNRGRSH